MIRLAERLQQTQEYYFSRKLREVRDLADQGKPIINMGIGSPDIAPPPSAVASLVNALKDAKAHQYQSYQGIPEFRKAISNFYQKFYGVSIDPGSEILPLMGSKEGIMHISLAFLNIGDEVLIPNPGYPTYESVAKIVGAETVLFNLNAENNWLPDLVALEKTNLEKVKLMWINYPNMPTGAKATEIFYKKLIAFAKKHNILIVNDNPYSFVLNDSPLSILKIEGAKEVAMELNSLSKSFNMAGWRVGMLLGKKEFVDAVLQIKSNMDSGMFYAIQKGAVAALNLESEWFDHLNSIYECRRKLIWQLAEKLGCTNDKNAVGLFVWAKLKKGIDDELFIDELLYEKSIFVTPGTIFGSNGKGYIRFSLCVSEEKIKEALERF